MLRQHQHQHHSNNNKEEEEKVHIDKENEGGGFSSGVGGSKSKVLKRAGLSDVTNVTKANHHVMPLKEILKTPLLTPLPRKEITTLSQLIRAIENGDELPEKEEIYHDDDDDVGFVDQVADDDFEELIIHLDRADRTEILTLEEDKDEDEDNEEAVELPFKLEKL